MELVTKGKRQLRKGNADPKKGRFPKIVERI